MTVSFGPLLFGSWQPSGGVAIQRKTRRQNRRKEMDFAIECLFVFWAKNNGPVLLLQR